MFNGKFKEAGVKQAELPEEDSDAFNLFLEWLYTSRLPLSDIAEHDKFKFINSEQSPFMHLVKLHCFAEKHCISELKDLTITILMSYYKDHNRLPKLDVIRFAYKYTSCKTKT